VLGALTTQRCLELGLSMNIRRRPERGSVWRIAPPLTVARDDIDLAMSIFDQALTEMKGVLARQSKAPDSRTPEVTPPVGRSRAGQAPAM
jgi:hypothetical protein